MRPRAWRMKSCGSLARFSAQSVSITPVSLLSLVNVKPRSCQNARSWGHKRSGGKGTKSQRCVPARSTRISPTAKGATVATLLADTVVPPDVAAALTTPPGS